MTANEAREAFSKARPLYIQSILNDIYAGISTNIGESVDSYEKSVPLRVLDEVINTLTKQDGFVVKVIFKEGDHRIIRITFN